MPSASRRAVSSLGITARGSFASRMASSRRTWRDLSARRALIEFDLVALADALARRRKNVRFIGCGREQDARRRRRS